MTFSKRLYPSKSANLMHPETEPSGKIACNLKYFENVLI